MVQFIRRACWCSLLFFVLTESNLLHAEEKSAGTLFVKDALTTPRESVSVEAKLFEKRLINEVGLGGEPLELVISKQVVTTSMTGGDGRGVLTHTPKALGVVPVLVRTGTSPRVEPAEGQGNLFVWERRNPILMIELAALTQKQDQAGSVQAFGMMFDGEAKPMPEAAEELEKLTRFYYRVIYVVMPAASGMDGFQASEKARSWLSRHQFPQGYVMVLPAGGSTLGMRIDELHEEGWKTIRLGIGRTKAFAEAFIQRRLDAIMVPEPSKGDKPRKAKVAQNWKEVRKKL